MLSEPFETHVALQLKLQRKVTWYFLSLKPCEMHEFAVIF